jgi:hypothetical protein
LQSLPFSIEHDLVIRPIFHKTEARIEACIFVAFLAYRLQVTLKTELRTVAGSMTLREVHAGCCKMSSLGWRQAPWQPCEKETRPR